MKKLALAFALVIGVMGLAACEETGPQKELRLFKEICAKGNWQSADCQAWQKQNSGV